MQIGTCITLTSTDDMEKRFQVLVNHGFHTCQLLCWDMACFTDKFAQKISGLLQKYDITPSAFWCGWTGPQAWNFYEGPLTLGLVPESYQAIRVQQLCDGADFAKKLGITDVVTHMGFIPENPNDPAFAPLCIAVRTVARHLKENGQYLLFETGQETPVAMLRCFEKVGLDNLGVNLDTANLILYGKANPVDALDVFGKYVRNIHAKDGRYPTNGHELGEETRIGEGKVDFYGVFTKLRELGYDSHVTIEREIVEDDQLLDIAEAAEPLQDILDARDYLQSVIDKVYG